MEQKNQSFTELDVWKKARILKNELKDLTSKFPPEEKFRLTDQLIRSSRSITANISEDQFNYYKAMIDETGRLLNGYITFLRNNIK